MTPLSDQRELREGAAFCGLGTRTRIELTGEDRTRFLHGLCTNDIQALQPGGGTEAFLTNVQGKTTGHVYVACAADRLVLDTVGGQSEVIIAGLDKYLIREDVEFHDRSEEVATFLVSGEKARQTLQEELTGLPAQRFAHQAGEWNGAAFELQDVPYCGANSFLLTCSTHAVQACTDSLRAKGMRECTCEAVDAVRIEAGTPLFGVDLTADNLPQEVNRDRSAISFEKGCYLGQETIARLDALGHVNRLLVGVRFAGTEVPPPGSVVHQDSSPVLRVTSSCWSESLSAPLALAYVRRALMKTGTVIESEFGTAEVVELPV